MEVGVLELVAPWPSRGLRELAVRRLLGRQLASVMPQAVAAWARRAGHRVHYAVYCGEPRPESLLPAELDVVFLSCHSTGSALAYALARLFQARGTLTVLGGPHATSFPADSLRFFDVVVDRCDAASIADLLEFPRDIRGVVTTTRWVRDLPTIEERLPEIRRSAFLAGRPYAATTIPLIASVGCPYTCDFCVDGSKPHVELPAERLEADLHFVAERFPGVRLAFHDPNFAVRFDRVLDVLERIPREKRSPYFMQCSLSILREERLARLAATRCVYVAPSLESWNDYSAKAGVGRLAGLEKLRRVAERIESIALHVSGIQVNFIFGLDADRGDDHVEITEAFIRRLPSVLATATVASPYGGTPFYDRLLREGRILEALPAAFYYLPQIPFVPLHETPGEIYGKLIRILERMSDPEVLRARMRSRLPLTWKLLHNARALASRKTLTAVRALRARLESDPEFRSFHEGRSRRLPAYYHSRLDSILGPYGRFLSAVDRVPVHERSAVSSMAI